MHHVDDDRDADAERLGPRIAQRRLVAGVHDAFDLIGQPAIVVIIVRHIAHLHRQLSEELAVVAHLDPRQPVGVLGDEIAELAHQRAAPRGGQSRPRPLREGAMRRADRPLDVGSVTARHPGPVLARHRIRRLQPGIARRIDEGAVDIVLIAIALVRILLGRADRGRDRIERKRGCGHRRSLESTASVAVDRYVSSSYQKYLYACRAGGRRLDVAAGLPSMAVETRA